MKAGLRSLMNSEKLQTGHSGSCSSSSGLRSSIITPIPSPEEPGGGGCSVLPSLPSGLFGPPVVRVSHTDDINLLYFVLIDTLRLVFSQIPSTLWPRRYNIVGEVTEQGKGIRSVGVG